jgi:hypothetical protein
MIDRGTRERKLMSLIINDLELDLTEPEMIELQQEVHDLPEEELDRALASRLELPFPLEERAVEQALGRVEEPGILHRGQAGSVSGTTGTGHETPGSGAREG